MNCVIEVMWKIAKYATGDNRTDVIFCKNCRKIGYEHYRKNDTMQSSQVMVGRRFVQGSLYNQRCEAA